MGTPSSVIVPTYARPAALDRCLAGLARQAPEAGEFEVLVMDDGTPVPVRPDPAATAGRYELRVIRQANAGPGAARNLGAREARGDVLAFTDDDCVPDPGWLAAIVAKVRQAPEVLAGGRTRNGLDGRIFSELSHLIVLASQEFHEGTPDATPLLPSNNLACSREEFLASGGFAPEFRLASEDRDFCDRWKFRGRPLVRVPDAVVVHFHDQGFPEFLRLHFRYGRGAYRYHAARRARSSGSMREEVGFHASFLPRFRALAPAGRGPGWHLRAAALLLAWQGANAAGFLAEMLSTARPGGRSTHGAEA